MQYFTAQCGPDLICKAVTDTPLPLAAPVGETFVELSSYDTSLLGQKWTGSSWEPAPPQPRVLSKTAFQDYAVSQLGAGATGMSRFTEIMDATRDSANGAARFAYARYEAAQTFEKTNTETLTGIMVSDGVMEASERTAILDNWPT